jgi:hypothetical protein
MAPPDSGFRFLPVNFPFPNVLFWAASYKVPVAGHGRTRPVALLVYAKAQGGQFRLKECSGPMIGVDIALATLVTLAADWSVTVATVCR